MQTFNQALASLLSRKTISMDEAFGRTNDPDELKNMIASGGGGNLPGQAPGGPAGRPPGR